MFAHTFTLFGLLAFSSAGLHEVTPSRLYLPATTTQQQTNTLFRANTNSVQPAQIHTVFSQQIPVTRTVQTHQIQTSNVPVQSVVSHQVPISVSHQVPIFASGQLTRQTTGTQQVSSAVNTNTFLRSSQNSNIDSVSIPSVVTSFQQVPVRQIAIVRLANENVGDGTYSYNYETENGIAAEEHGQANVAGDEIVERVQGSYSYTGPDNVRYTVNYVADENGYRAEGAHLPVPPSPIAQESQSSSGISQITRNVVDTRSASSGVHVIPTTVISQPLQIVQAPNVHSQRQATLVQSTYQQQVPVFQSQQNIVHQSSAVPASTVTVRQGAYAQRSSAVVAPVRQVLQRQSNLVPSSSFSVVHGSSGFSSQHTGVNSVQNQQVIQRQSAVLPVTVGVQQSSSGYAQQVGASVQAQQVLQRQSAVAPSSTVTVQQGGSGYTAQHVHSSTQGQQVLQRQSAVVPSSTVAVQQSGSGYFAHSQQVDSSAQAQQVLQRQSAVAPSSTVTVQQGGSGYTAQQVHSSTQGQQVLQRQSTVVPSSTVAVQQSGSGYFAHSQQVDSSAQAQQVLQRQSAVAPSSTVTVQQGGSGYTAQQVHSSGQAQQVLQRQSAVIPSSNVAVQQGSSGFAVQHVDASAQGQHFLQRGSAVVPASTVAIQQGASGYTSQQTGLSGIVQHDVLHQHTVQPSSTVTFQQGFLQRQTVVPSNIVTVPQGRIGIINQRGNQQVQTQLNNQHRSSGVSSSHVTVQLGTTGYATEQVGDSSSVQILDGITSQNTVPANHVVQQVTQQPGVSGVQSQQVVQGETVVPANVSEQHNQQVQSQTVVPANNVNEQQSVNHGTSGSQQGVVLPDGTVHHGY